MRVGAKNASEAERDRTQYDYGQEAGKLVPTTGTSRARAVVAHIAISKGDVRSAESRSYNGPPLPLTRGSSRSQTLSMATPDGGRQANKSERKACSRRVKNVCTRDLRDVHHTQRIALAAKQFVAKAIRNSLCGR